MPIFHQKKERVLQHSKVLNAQLKGQPENLLTIAKLGILFLIDRDHALNTSSMIRLSFC